MQQWCTQVGAKVKGHGDHCEGFMLHNANAKQPLRLPICWSVTSMFLMGTKPQIFSFKKVKRRKQWAPAVVLAC